MRDKVGRADVGIGPYGGGYKGYSKTGRRGRRPLRKRNKKCNGERNPPVTASPCQPPLGKGAEGTGVRIATGALRPRNDRFLHGVRIATTSDIGHWFRNDRVTRSAADDRRREGNKECGTRSGGPM